MTKEECEKALETIGDWPLWDSERTESGMWEVKDASRDEYKVIEKLINEHFDNPPLKFEDLKEGRGKKMKKQQCVVRTAPTSSSYWYEGERMKHLSGKLNEGWIVVMCNPIGNDLEYILEKEVETKEEQQ